MRTIQTEFETGSLKKETLLIGTNIPKITEIPDEIKILSDKYDDFGIRNSTSKFIKKTDSNIRIEIKKQQQNKVESEGLQLLMNLFFPFKIIPYKTINNVASDYNLVIAPLSYYDKPIDEENIQDLQNFKDLIAAKINNLNKVRFPKGNKFSFSGNCFTNEYNLDFTNYFNIVAPKSHFDFRGHNTLQIGSEIKRHEKKPGFKFNLKVNIPEPKDPIIIAPFIFLDKLYSFVVTAWDEVANDRRIRSMIK